MTAPVNPSTARALLDLAANRQMPDNAMPQVSLGEVRAAIAEARADERERIAKTMASFDELTAPLLAERDRLQERVKRLTEALEQVTTEVNPTTAAYWTAHDALLTDDKDADSGAVSLSRDEKTTKALAALVNLDTLAAHGTNGRGGPPLHDDLKALLSLVAGLCRFALTDAGVALPATREARDTDSVRGKYYERAKRGITIHNEDCLLVQDVGPCFCKPDAKDDAHEHDSKGYAAIDDDRCSVCGHRSLNSVARDATVQGDGE